jgi:hypothetical protein
MEKFQVMEQTKPSRCEICHQVDRFDPFTETCLRCQALIITNQLPELEAQRYQQRQQSANQQPHPPQEVKVPTNELFRVVDESAKLCWRNFSLLLKIFAIIQLPIIVIGILNVIYPLGGKVPAISMIVSLLIGVISAIASSIGAGAMTKAVMDRYRGETTSVTQAYQFILQKGWRFVATSMLGVIYQSIGVLFCLVGGLYTYPSGAFVTEVALVEDKYFRQAFRRSHKLGMINMWMTVLLYLLWMGVGGVIGAGAGIISGGLVGLLLALKIVSGAQNLALIFTISLQILASLASVALVPFLHTSKLLLYFHLRMRSDDDPGKMVYEPKVTYPMPAGN